MYGIGNFQAVKMKDTRSNKFTELHEKLDKINKRNNNLLKLHPNMLIVRKLHIVDDRYDNPFPKILKSKSRSLERESNKKIREIEKNIELLNVKQKEFPIQKLPNLTKIKKILIPAINKLSPIIKINEKSSISQIKNLNTLPRDEGKSPVENQINKLIKSYDSKSLEKKSNINYVKEMLRAIMKMRKNWRESFSELSNTFNFKWTPTKRDLEFGILSKQKVRMVNHFEFETEISNKKFLFLNFLEYCEKNNLNAFDYLPFTIIMKVNGTNYKDNLKNFGELHRNIKKYILLDNHVDKEMTFPDYADYFTCDINNYKISSNKLFIPSSHYTGRNLWLIKPTDLYGGKCIQIADNVDDIEKFLKKFYEGIEKGYQQDQEMDSESENSDGDATKQRYRASTVLVQKYIENPLLYYGRKFDIRMWVLIDHNLGVYLFKEGHLKTTSTKYTTDSKDLFVHITNYSLQKYNNNFEKFEEGNEVSFTELQQCLDTEYKDYNIDIKRDIIPQMVNIIKYSTLSVKNKINKKHRKFCYVVLGYDFMIDVNFKVWLIEVNKNPGLVESSQVIKMLIPRMIDDSFRLTIDLIFDNQSTSIDNNGLYTSPFHVDKYSDNENMFEFLHSLNN